MRYLISYDLMAPGKDYKTLYEALEKLGAKRVLKSQWAVRLSNTTCVKVRDWVWQYMDPNDRLLVNELDSGGWASYRAMVDLNSI